jgi:hypothetical protein
VVFDFVVYIEKVEIESAEIGLDLDDAVVAPMHLHVSDGMSMRALVSLVIPMRLKLRLVKGIDVLDVPKVS